MVATLNSSYLSLPLFYISHLHSLTSSLLLTLPTCSLTCSHTLSLPYSSGSSLPCSLFSTVSSGSLLNTLSVLPPLRSLCHPPSLPLTRSYSHMLSLFVLPSLPSSLTSFFFSLSLSQCSQRGSPSVIPSGLLWNLPHKSERRTVPHRPSTVPGRPPPSYAVPCCPPPSSAVFRCFPLFSAVLRCPLPSPAVPYRPPPSPTIPRRPLPSPAVPYHPLPSPAVLYHPWSSSTTPGRPLPPPAVPYQNMSQIVGLVVLPNDGRPGNSRTRTDGILLSRLVLGSWQSPPGPTEPRMAENTALSLILVVTAS